MEHVQGSRDGRSRLNPSFSDGLPHPLGAAPSPEGVNFSVFSRRATVTVEKLSDRFSRMTVRFGFMEHPNVPKALKAASFDLENASFYLSRRALRASPHSGLPLWQDYLFIPLARAAGDVSDQFCIPENRAVEVGARITI